MRHRRKLSFITMHSFTQITSRIELRGIVPSNQIKVTFIIILFYPSAWFVFYFFPFHIEIEGKCGWIIGGEGAKGMLVAPLSNYWVGLPPPLFHIEIEGKCGWNIGGRGQRVCWWPPSQIIGWAFPPLPPPSVSHRN